ncbi:hypothetical protein [Pseudoalteromonas sp. Of7M-16]|uniref:TlpA family protein disulfide reductase n=1 Tax=Pseudoalteromonas sp. Of7M-16 TaxID=2917756 RepID=UPI001EF64A3E|nr:hypothetical protein [Pseudoalteromonas sp. Of7M-16]MCG7551115.1 hypothetical protein [Pseudoalteromonas sp. Of7M-16]
MYIQVKRLIILGFLLLSYNAQSTTVEYVFINIWDEYTHTTQLPNTKVKRIFIQPDINVDKASVELFIDAYPIYQGLTIDKHNHLMNRFQVRKTPTSVLVENEQVISKRPLTTTAKTTSKPKRSSPLQTLSGKPLLKTRLQQDYQVLFFSDSLCPFQHIPACEKRIAQNNQLAKKRPEKFLTVIKPFYVDEHSAYAYKKRFAVQHDMVFDTYNQLFEYYQITELPYWVVFDTQGKVIYRSAHMPTRDHISL